MPSRHTPDRYPAQWDPSRVCATVPGETADDEPARAFPMWTGCEIARLGLIAGLLVAPFAVGVPHPKALSTLSSERASAEPHAAAPWTTSSAGSLRAIRVTEIDVKALDAATFADAADH